MIRVLIVDDSALVRKNLKEALSQFEDIEVVGGAVDPYDARDQIFSLKPDVLTLDVEMPRMDGISFLSKLMKHYPLPVVVLSSLTPRNSETAIQALSLGAVEVICKPGSQFSVPEVSKELVRAIRSAATSRPAKRPAGAVDPVAPVNVPVTTSLTTHKVIAIGASTGGIPAIETVLAGFPPNVPGTVIGQHMPETFTAAFAQRLDGACALHVREARDGDPVAPGMVLIAPGDYHLLVERDGARYFARVKKGPRVHFQRPSVDVLFQSVARSAGKNAVGVLLTGMGRDGAKGLLEMREAGARTFAQDEKTSVVFGMPREALALGAAEEAVPLQEVSRTILEALEEKEPRRSSQAARANA